jgi:hypothetical protein
LAIIIENEYKFITENYKKPFHHYLSDMSNSCQMTNYEIASKDKLMSFITGL